MFRIFGPPGTGKTTTLLNMVDRALESGVPATSIAFLAFTKKAANEAKERAAARFGLDPKTDLFYFRTIHSLALALTDIRHEQIMSGEHYRELSQQIGVSLGNQKNENVDDITDITSSKCPILGLINLARLKKTDLREEYNHSNINDDWLTVNHVANSLREYKDAYNLYDFTDMLEKFVEQAGTYCPPFKLCFLDEAQDLSPLQWDIAYELDKKSEKMYCAGDDDQAIYRWAGADVDTFINLPGGSEVLEQSYRIPSSVHELAEKVSSRIHRRFPKSYKAKQERGNVQHIATIDALDMAEGSWLIMAQAGYQLAPIANDLKSNGYLFTYRGRRSISERIATAVNSWERLRKDKTISGDQARAVYSYMSLGSRVTKGFKRLPNFDDSDEVSLQDLQTNGGLVVGKELVWHEALDKLPQKERAYITALLRRGEKFNGEPRITVSTIHGTKGGEADNVVLFTDLTPSAEEEMRTNPDDIHRVFYVAITRARQNLYIVQPEDVTRSYDL